MKNFKKTKQKKKLKKTKQKNIKTGGAALAENQCKNIHGDHRTRELIEFNINSMCHWKELNFSESIEEKIQNHNQPLRSL